MIIAQDSISAPQCPAQEAWEAGGQCLQYAQYVPGAVFFIAAFIVPLCIWIHKICGEIYEDENTGEKLLSILLTENAMRLIVFSTLIGISIAVAALL